MSRAAILRHASTTSASTGLHLDYGRASGNCGQCR
jgi:hypothetical protein